MNSKIKEMRNEIRKNIEEICWIAEEYRRLEKKVEDFDGIKWADLELFMNCNKNELYYSASSAATLFNELGLMEKVWVWNDYRVDFVDERYIETIPNYGGFMSGNLECGKFTYDDDTIFFHVDFDYHGNISNISYTWDRGDTNDRKEASELNWGSLSPEGNYINDYANVARLVLFNSTYNESDFDSIGFVKGKLAMPEEKNGQTKR